jgi:hypothetical protein
MLGAYSLGSLSKPKRDSFSLSHFQRFSNTTFLLGGVERLFIDASFPNGEGCSGVYKQLHNKERSVRCVCKGLTYPNIC